VIETTLMVHHFPNQNMTHQQTSKDPNSKHEMENKTQKYTKEKPTCVLEFQITKNDLKTHNLGLCP
jgi:hypothetical protein